MLLTEIKIFVTEIDSKGMIGVEDVGLFQNVSTLHLWGMNS